jgi:GT2 family glycosyltransferase
MAARGDYLVFLNPDVVVSMGWLQRLQSHLDTHADVALIAPETLYPHETRQLRAGIADRTTLPGAALMVPRHYWNLLGGFDETIFLYWEDTDLCWRAQRRGYRTVAACDVAVVHHRGGSGGGNMRWLHQYIQNGLYVHLKLQPWWRVAWFICRQVLAWPLHVARGASPRLWQALVWNMRHRATTMQLRTIWRTPRPPTT